MFDSETIKMLNALPQIGELTADVARQRLSQAYLELTRLRLSADLDSDEDLQASIRQLREMSNGLEVYCLIEYHNQGRLLESGRAAAFIAAQSLELLLRWSKTIEFEDSPRHLLADIRMYSQIEAGLLYLISGYYANARAMVERRTPENYSTIDDYSQLRQTAVQYFLLLLTGLIRQELDVRDSPSPLRDNASEYRFSRAPSDLTASIEARLFLSLSDAVRIYMDFLAGGDIGNAQIAREQVIQVQRQVTEAILPESLLKAPAEALLPYHLASLLEIVFGDLQFLAIVHRITPPSDSDTEYQSLFSSWLRAKAARHYSLLWQSTVKWLEVRQESESAHVVISMPTGSGKSFLAELALAEHLHEGWGLYLAPTNALVRQIQRDLRQELQELNIKVLSFLTEEYTTLQSESFAGASPRTVVVMTPEKASLAIRLKPEAFEDCSVCIFDECHLIAKDGRGAISDDFMGRLLDKAPRVKVVLMSAMLADDGVEKLTAWLRQATSHDSRPVQLKWKPTRSLRALAILPEQGFEDATWDAKGKSECPVDLLGYARNAWQDDLQDSDPLYIHTLLPTTVTIKRTANGRSFRYEWADSVNTGARQIAVSLAKRGMSTLLFINTLASHVWKPARDSPDLSWIPPNDLGDAPGLVESWLLLADSELGCKSLLRGFHPKGITVHSGALIDEERRAAEIAYKSGMVGLMVATGTLSQGLNFPTQTVVMAGIEGNPHAFQPQPEDILNSLGRSGRAGSHNVGLSILVPKPIIRSVSRLKIARETPNYFNLLKKNEACLDPSSALKVQVDDLIEASQRPIQESEPFSAQNLETATLIFGSANDANKTTAFRRSYAAYMALSVPEYVSKATHAAETLVKAYVAYERCPDWLPELAHQAGVSVAVLHEMYKAIQGQTILNTLVIKRADFVYPLDVFRQTVSRIWPVLLTTEFGLKDQKNRPPILDNLPTRIKGKDMQWDVSPFRNSSDWRSLLADDANCWGKQWVDVFDFLRDWMQGRSYLGLAETWFSTQDADEESSTDANLSNRLTPSHRPKVINKESRADTNPIQKAITNINDLRYSLRRLCGAFVLLITKLLTDEGLITSETDVPLAVGMLPQAIHWGVDRIDKAFWHYHLFPTRTAAHSLSVAFPIEYENDLQVEIDIRMRVLDIRKDLSILTAVTTNEDVKKILNAVITLMS